MKNKFLIVKTTYAKMIEAKKLAKILLTKKLAACIQFSKIESLYSWNNKIIQEKEILVEIKTTKKLYNKIEKEILKNHSYKLPQIIAIEIKNGEEGYFKWIEENL